MDYGGFFRGGLYYGPGEAPYKPSPSPYRTGEPRRRNPQKARPAGPMRKKRYYKPHIPSPSKWGTGAADAAADLAGAMPGKIAKNGWKAPFKAVPWIGWGLLLADLIPWQVFEEPYPIQDILADGGFTQCCTLGVPVDTFQYYPDTSCRPASEICNITVGCGLPLQVPSGDIGVDPITWPARGRCTVATTGRRRVILLGVRTSDSPSRHTITEIWSWVAPNREAIPQLDMPYPVPEVPPIYTLPPAPYFTPFPDDAPLTSPSPMPAPMPWPMVAVTPRVSDWPQGRVGLEPGANPNPKPGSGLNPDPNGPRTDPTAGPSKETTGGRTRAGPKHQYRRPGRRVRETKRLVTTAGARLLKLTADYLGKYGGESADFIDAVYYAMGTQCKGANTPQAKLLCISKHYKTIDFGQMVKNLAMNELQDRGIGFIGKHLKEAAKKNPFFDDGRGYQTGGGAARYHLQQVKI